jgi:hypothetical protein
MNINIILSAKLIDKELQNILGKIPSALIPFSGTAAIDEIYKRTLRFYNKQYIVVYENKELVIEHIKNKRIDINIIEIDSISSLGYSVWFAINQIISENNRIDNLTISFADTLINEQYYGIIVDNNCFLYTKTIDSERWTTFENNGELIINDKKNNLNRKEFNTFIGTFNIKNINLFLDCLTSVLNSKSVESSMDAFYYAIKNYNTQEKFNEVIVHDWIDLGHEDLYYEGKKNVAPRFFNSIEIDKKRGILKKTSKDKEKFSNEIKWYLQLPSDLQYLSPRIFNYSLDYDNQYIKMEFYGYNTLHELYLYGNHSTEKWRIILKELLEVNDEFRKFQLNISNEELSKVLNSIYYDKTINRIKKLKQDNNFELYFRSKEIIINGHTYKNLDYYMKNLKLILENSGIYSLKNLNIIHGDYFFANILYDIKGNIIRLIDPRGDFGGAGLYGDFRYDIAKLSHSILGDYDFIIEDLFEIDELENRINYNIYYRDIHLRIKALFKEIISTKYEIIDIELIESLLFLSMIPLHSDQPTRQKLMMCVGIQKLDKIINAQLDRGVKYD